MSLRVARPERPIPFLHFRQSPDRREDRAIGCLFGNVRMRGQSDLKCADALAVIALYRSLEPAFAVCYGYHPIYVHRGDLGHLGHVFLHLGGRGIGGNI